MKKMNRRVRSMEIRSVNWEQVRTIAEYASEYELDESTVRYRLATRKIMGHKIYGRWYVIGARDR